MIVPLRRWLNNLPIIDPVDRQMAAVLQVVLLGLMSIIVLAGIVNLLIPASTFSVQTILLQSFFALIIIGIPLLLLRRGFFRSSVFVIIAILLSVELFALLSKDLRQSAETLAFFTIAILLAGLLVSPRAMLLTFAISAGAVLFIGLSEQEPDRRLDEITVVGNFILLNGLMSLLLGHFGMTLRAAQAREHALNNEIYIRKQAEAALQHFADRLEILHEIDRSLLSAQSVHDIAKTTLLRVRKLIPCPRASVTLFDLEARTAWFLAADYQGMESIPHTPIPLEEFGLNVIEDILTIRGRIGNKRQGELTEHGHQHILCGDLRHLLYAGGVMVVGGER